MVKVPLNPNQFCRKAALTLMLFFAGTFLLPGTFAADVADAEAASFIKSYEEENNNILKRNMLREMARNTRETGNAVAQWKKDLLFDALSEKDPTVVESAVQQMEKLNLAVFNQKLITLYHNTGELFANMYDSRVRISIVTTLGKTGGADNNVYTLFQGILTPQEDNFSYVQGDVLQAIRRLNDPRYIPMVENYSDFMKSAVEKKKTAGEDPMFYQILLNYSSICDNIIRTLKKQERR